MSLKQIINSKTVTAWIIVILFFTGCGTSYSPDVQETLDKAGDNRAELEKVLEHFAQDSDTLKYQAAIYLIGNMGEHSYAKHKLVDTSGEKVEIVVTDYPDYDSLKMALEVIESERGELDYKRDTLIYDRDFVPASYLIKQIDRAFKAWREKPWARELTFEQFRDYVLPYRGSNEPLEPWREFFMEKFKHIEKQMKDPTDPVEAAYLINADIKTWFGFDARYYLHPTDQGLTEMIESGLGRCEDMTNLTIYAMRANGIAVTSDYTPYWANYGNNHAWNSIIIPGKGAVPFMGSESNPGEYSLSYMPGKVYRKMFGKHKSNLAFQKNQQEKTPRWLSGENYINVSHEYGLTTEQNIILDKDIPDSVDIAYLCVFNSGYWKPIDWAKIARSDDGNTGLFSNFASDIVFLPALYINEEIQSCGIPFYIDSTGMHKLIPDNENKISLRLTSTNPKNYHNISERADKSRLAFGKEYELFYWDNEWQSLGKKTADENPLIFNDIPNNALFWLIMNDSDREERIFHSTDGDMILWR